MLLPDMELIISRLVGSGSNFGPGESATKVGHLPPPIFSILRHMLEELMCQSVVLLTYPYSWIVLSEPWP
jgi:hypothetical protein